MTNPGFATTNQYKDQAVAILAVDAANQQATGLTRRESPVIIDLRYHVGAVQTTPSAGEQWIISALTIPTPNSGLTWVLKSKIPFNSPEITLPATEGQQQIGSGTGPIQLHGTQVNANGPLRLANANSSLADTIAKARRGDSSTSSLPAASTTDDGSLAYDGNNPVFSQLGKWLPLYTKPSAGIPATDLSPGVQSALTGAYQVPTGGIPPTDLSTTVQSQLNLATTALQTVPDSSVALSQLATTGTPSSTTFLNGLMQWVTVGTSSALQTLLDGLTGITGANPSDFISLFTTLLGNISGDISGTSINTMVANILTKLQNINTNTGLYDISQGLDNVAGSFLKYFDTGTGQFDAAQLFNLANIGAIAQASVTNLVTDLGNLLSTSTWTSFLSQANTALGTAGSDLTHLIGGLGAIPQANIPNLINTLQNINASTGLYDISQGLDNVAGSFLKYIDTTTGKFDASQLFNISGIPAIAQSSITGLVSSLSSLLSTSTWQSWLDQITGAGAGLGTISAFLTKIGNLNSSGLFDASQLSNISNIPALAISKITNLTGYLSHLNTSGVLSGLANVLDGSGNPLSGYLTNMTTSGAFPWSHVLDGSSNPISGYLANLTSGGIMSPSGISSIFGLTNMAADQQTVVDYIYQATHPSASPITVVQTASGTSPASMAFTNPVTAGNSIVVLLIGYTPGTTPALSANMYAPVNYNGSAVSGAIPLWNQGSGSNIVISTNGTFDAVLAGWLIPNVGAGNTVTTATVSGITGNGFSMYEVSGLGTHPVVGQTSFNHGNGTTAVNSGTTSALTTAPAFIVGGSGDTGSVPSPSSGGWTTVNPAGYCALSYQIATSTGGTYTWSATGTSGDWGAAVATISAGPATGNALSTILTSLTSIPNQSIKAFLGGANLGTELSTLMSGFSNSSSVLAQIIASFPHIAGGLSGLSGLGSILTDVTGLLGGPTSLGSGSPVLPAITSIPVLGGLLTGSAFKPALLPNALGGTNLVADVSAVATTLFGSPTTASHVLPASIGNVLGGSNLGADVTSILATGISALGGSTSTLTDFGNFLQKIPATNLHKQIIPTIDAVGSVGSTTGFSTTGGSITASPGADVFAFVSNNFSSVPTLTVTIGGTPAIVVPGSFLGINNLTTNGSMSVYRLAGGGTGSPQAVVASVTSTGGSLAVFPISYTGVTGVGSIQTAYGSTSPGSLPMTVGTNQVALVGITMDSTITGQSGGNSRGFGGVATGNEIAVSDSTTSYTATATVGAGAWWAAVGLILTGNNAPSIDTSIIPDVTQAMSSGISTLVNTATYALDNTFGLTGNTPASLGGLLSQLPTMLHNFGFGTSSGTASVSSANAALNAMAGTIQSQGQAIAALRSQLSSSSGLAASVTFQSPAESVYSPGGSYTWTHPSWFTFGADIVDGTVLGSGAGGDGAGFGASAGGVGSDTTMTLSGTGGGTITGTHGPSEGGATLGTGAGMPAGTQMNDDEIYVGGSSQGGAGAGGLAPGGGGAAATGFNRFGGGAGTWGTATWKPAVGSSITGTVGSGGFGGGGAGGTGGNGAYGQAWVLARQAIQSQWTAGATVRRVQIYQYNVATTQTDSQEVSAIWSAAPGGSGTGHLIFIRGNSALDTLVYLLISYVSGVTNYELGCYNAGTNHVFQTGTFSSAIPFNEFSLESDTGRDFTVSINGNPEFTYSDSGALSAAPGSSYRIGGWGSSDQVVANQQSHGSLTQWAFTDAGVPLPVATQSGSYTTTSTTYADLNQSGATLGPSVLFNVPASGIISIDLYALITPASGQQAWMGFVLSGLNTMAAVDNQALTFKNPSALTTALGASARITLTGLTPGLTTAKAVYRAGTTTAATFANRMMTVDSRW